ncbi:MAG: LEPR-XLL domain-containing protein, partial [Betaproteobacteria bacterium]
MSGLLQKLLRTTFQVEPLEQRILLSADPAAAAVQALALRDAEHILFDNGIRAAGEIDDLERAGRTGDLLLGAIEPGASPEPSFAVDSSAFDVELARTRAAFMDSALAAADPGYGRFMEGVLSVQVLKDDATGQVAAVLDASATGPWSAEAPGPADLAADSTAWLRHSLRLDGELRLDEGLFDTARLAREVGSVDLRALVVGPGATLAGSGVIDAPTLVEGTLAPGYSPGLISYESGLTLTDATRTVIELGGTAPATLADAGSGAFHDRINVTGLATLNGTLDLELVNGFTPKAGDEFVVFSYGSVQGRFDAVEGLFGLHSNIWFDLVQTGDASTAGQLKLVAKELVPGAGQALPLQQIDGSAGVLDQIGQLLNADYFVSGSLPAVNFSADFTVGGFDIDGGAFRLSWDDARDRALLQVSGAVDLGPVALSGDITVAIPTGSGDAVEVSLDNGSFVLAAGGAKLSASGIDGGFVLSSAGVAGVLRVGSLALTNGSGAPLAGIDLSGVRDVHVGFNTTGRSVVGSLPGLAFDYSAQEHHDFFAVDADLDLKLTVGPVAYTLSGRFGISSTEFEVDGTAAQGLMLSVKDASTALAAAGVMVKLGDLQGGAVLGTVRGQFGTIGNVKVGAVALTRDDGSELIPGLSMLPLDLPFSFNTFVFTESNKPAFSWPKLDLSALSFPYLDLSLPELPSFNLPSLGSFGPGIDWSSLSLPQLGALLPSFGMSLPGFDLKLPNLTLPSLSAGGTGLGIDWPNLSLAQFVFSLPRLNLPGLKPDFSLLLEKFNNFGWGTALPTGWGTLNLSALLTDLKARIDAGSLPGLSLSLPDLSGLSLGGVSLSALKLGDLNARLPSVDLNWGALSLPELLLSLP